jgi:hypothetical protein
MIGHESPHPNDKCPDGWRSAGASTLMTSINSSLVVSLCQTVDLKVLLFGARLLFFLANSHFGGRRCRSASCPTEREMVRPPGCVTSGKPIGKSQRRLRRVLRKVEKILEGTTRRGMASYGVGRKSSSMGHAKVPPGYVSQNLSSSLCHSQGATYALVARMLFGLFPVHRLKA